MKFFIVFSLLSVFFYEDVSCRKTRYRRDTSTTRIVGGRPGLNMEFPYQVFLQVLRGEKSFRCGGSIISNKTILTAAHCLVGATTINVKMGITSINEVGEEIITTKFTLHPNYNNNSFDYDIGIITLDNPVQLDEVKQKAVRLAAEGTQVTDGQEVIVAGWGATSEKGNFSDNLLVVDLQIVTYDECRKIYPSLTKRMFCAGVLEGDKDACWGDSGGPAVTMSDNVQVGVVSTGLGCARKGYPGVYTSVSSVRDWIKQVSGV